MTKAFATFDLYEAGQSPWLDNISRDLLKSGSLKQMIEEQGLKGVTSNPSIFQKAISSVGSSGNRKGKNAYESDIRKLIAAGKSTLDIYDALTIEDIKGACELFKPIFKETNGEHGFVSLEVLPSLADDTVTTVIEAKRLWKAVNQPNVMIKIPATPEGIPAIKELISEGININITLMFSVKHYKDVANAYIEGVEALVKKGGDPSKVHSVASVFVSRIDSYVDDMLDERILAAKDLEKKAYFENLKGKAAIINAKLVYQEFKKIFFSERFKKLMDKGAKLQKPLWASTSTKNPAYHDLLYVDSLVGEHTVNTLPQGTLDALLDHGDIEHGTVEENLSEIKLVVSDLNRLGIDLTKVGETLQSKGVEAFIESFDELMKTIEKHKNKKLKAAKAVSIKYSIGNSALVKECQAELEALKSANFLNRFLDKDPEIWKKEASHKKVINNRLGWLRSHQWIVGKLYELDLISESIKKEKIKDVVLLGMGGSSLAPEVMSLICPRKKQSPNFTIVDTTDPSSILSLESKLNLKSTLFIVASKSGGTVETLSQYQYFYSRVEAAYGSGMDLSEIGKHFIAITDKGSDLQKLAKEKLFRKTFVNPSDIGGRFSALSFFGLVPAALMGADVRSILKSAARYYFTLENGTHLSRNQGIYCGAILGFLAKHGRDKLTLYTSKTLGSFSCWMEQLIAESTGKEKRGIIPIEGESPASVKTYGDDRVFVFLKLKSDPAGDHTKAIRNLKEAGHPVIEIEWPDGNAIGESFLFWEVATSMAGAILGINPFDEPNVKECKDITKKLLAKIEKGGKLSASKSLIKTQKDLEGLFKSFKEGSYLALLIYAERDPKVIKAFARIRKLIQKTWKVPVLVGFGPRYLHSIGQLYKGGPKTGVFVEFLKTETNDVEIPGQPFTFGQLKMAQALGDFEAISSKKIPVAAYELGKGTLAGVEKFEKLLTAYAKKIK